MEEKAIVRCSALPMGARCVSHLATTEEVQREDGVPTDISGDASMLGRAYHSVLQAWAFLDFKKLEPEARAAAQKFKVPADELLQLLRFSAPDPKRGQPTLLEAEVEVSHDLGPCILSGHVDLVRYWESHAFLEITDYKTGRLVISEEEDAVDHEQLNAYIGLRAGALEAEEKKIERVRGVLHKTRLGGEAPDEFELVGDEVASRYRDIQDLALRMHAQREMPPEKREYRVGGHCRHLACRRRCRAYRADMDTALATVGEISVTTLNAPRLFELRQRVKKLHDGLDDALKETVRIMGPIVTADGKQVLEFRPQDRRPGIGVTHVKIAFSKVMAASLGKADEATIRKFMQFEEQILQYIEDRDKMGVERFGLFKIPKAKTQK